ARKRAADDDAARKAEEAQQKADAEAARKKAEEDDAKRKAEADAAVRRSADEESRPKPASAPTITDCDRLSASPYDKDRPYGADGVSSIADVAAAKTACDDASRRYPDIARFLYQGGRTARQRGDYTKALDLFRNAASKGSIAAFSGLGLHYLLGQGVARDY